VKVVKGVMVVEGVVHGCERVKDMKDMKIVKAVEAVKGVKDVKGENRARGILRL
jgi:hypothetical protein